MKRAVALLLALTLLLAGCGQKPVADAPVATAVPLAEPDTVDANLLPATENDAAENTSVQEEKTKPELPQFTGMDDPALCEYVEDEIYKELVDQLDSEDYFVENVSTAYMSKEYLEEVAFNSQTNIFFGYSLADLDAQFEGTRYVFTLGEDGETAVEPFEEYDDDTFEQVIKNVAVGSGVILVCVTVSVVSAGVGAPAVSMIFATSAKTSAIYALFCGTVGAASAGIVTGMQTGNFDQALKAAALTGSESFKWGAFNGALKGGTSAANALKGATLNGLTMNEAAAIQKESKYPIDVIKQIKSMDEYEIYKKAGLKPAMVGKSLALVRENIDLSYVSELNGKQVTNLDRMSEGYAPIDTATQTPYQLHHINQDPNGTLAILTGSEHHGNAAILNVIGKESEINRTEFDIIRSQFWKDFAKNIAYWGTDFKMWGSVP